MTWWLWFLIGIVVGLAILGVPILYKKATSALDQMFSW